MKFWATCTQFHNKWTKESNSKYESRPSSIMNLDPYILWEIPHSKIFKKVGGESEVTLIFALNPTAAIRLADKTSGEEEENFTCHIYLVDILFTLIFAALCKFGVLPSDM